MGGELTEHAVSLAAAPSAAEEDFEHLALQQPNLGSVAARRPDDLRGGLLAHFPLNAFSAARRLRI